jgi:hypothetical protein
MATFAVETIHELSLRTMAEIGSHRCGFAMTIYFIFYESINYQL